MTVGVFPKVATETMTRIEDLKSLDTYIKEQKNKDFIYFSDIPEICKNEPW